MNYLKKSIDTTFGLVIICSFLATFNSYPAFWLVKQGLFMKESLGFQMSVTLSGIFLMLVIPILVIKYILDKKPEDFGLRLPDSIRQAVILTFTVTMIFLPIIFLLAKQRSFQQYYQINTGIIGFSIITIIQFFYFLSEEFFFRGFLFLSLWNKIKYHSFWLTNLVFAIFHITKPGGEILFAFFFGTSLSYLTYKTKSFVPALFAHFMFALLLNILVNFVY